MKESWEVSLAWGSDREMKKGRDFIEKPAGMPADTHRGYGIDGVQDGKEKHTVNAPGVI